jgi:NAD(P)-dependent dehydrogenase (short-subunit alcohol dehydrogenase family)
MTGKKLQGQVAIVTGGGRGIGATTGRLLAQAGAAVTLIARSEEEIEAVAASLREEGLRAIAVAADVSDAVQIEEVVEATIEQFGRVDLLVNNAAVIYPLDQIVYTDPDEWAYNIHVNLVGPYQAIRGVLPLMLDQQFGRIVNVTSGAALRPIVGASAYCSAKAGLNMLTQAVAAEMAAIGQTRVTVNGFDPGLTDTEMQADIRDVDAEEVGLDLSYYHRAHAEGRLRSPEEAARAIYWLLGPWSLRETGKVWRLDDEEWRTRFTRDIA